MHAQAWGNLLLPHTCERYGIYTVKDRSSLASDRSDRPLSFDAVIELGARHVRDTTCIHDDDPSRFPGQQWVLSGCPVDGAFLFWHGMPGLSCIGRMGFVAGAAAGLLMGRLECFLVHL